MKIMKILEKIGRYASNFRPRHANNVNLILHIIGIPEAFFGLFQMFTFSWKTGLLNFFLGYLWQWIGHTYFEKNEVGEIIALRALIKRLMGDKHGSQI